jgi:hypothetical protein
MGLFSLVCCIVLLKKITDEHAVLIAVLVLMQRFRPRDTSPVKKRRYQMLKIPVLLCLCLFVQQTFEIYLFFYS